MCSTPRSNPGASAPKRRIKSFAEEFTAQERRRFAEVANRAEERRAQRTSYQRRRDDSQQKSAATKAKPVGLINWLGSWVSIN